MLKATKTDFIQSVNANNWYDMVKRFDIKYKDVFSKNRKYTIETDNGKACSCYTISNGNAFDCPSLKLGKCNMNCYGLKGCYRWNTPQINKRFQQKVLQYAPNEWLFEAIKYLANSTRIKECNRLTEVRLNEVSDLTQTLLDKWCNLCEMLLKDEATSHIQTFTYTKMSLDFSKASELSNFCINTSQAINPIYENGNIYYIVDKTTYDSITENDIIKKCNCEIACKDCGMCYKDNGKFIYAKLH